MFGYLKQARSKSWRDYNESHKGSRAQKRRDWKVEARKKHLV